MDLLDLIKATIACGLLAFFSYTYPALGQGIVIGVLALLWLGYARKAILTCRRRRSDFLSS